MTKDQSPFCYPENIQGEMDGLFSRLAAAVRDAGAMSDCRLGLRFDPAQTPLERDQGRADLGRAIRLRQESVP